MTTQRLATPHTLTEQFVFHVMHEGIELVLIIVGVDFPGVLWVGVEPETEQILVVGVLQHNKNKGRAQGKNRRLSSKYNSVRKGIGSRLHVNAHHVRYLASTLYFLFRFVW